MLTSVCPQLGCPTANIKIENIPWIKDAVSGVYFGWCSIQLPAGHPALGADRPTQPHHHEPDPAAPSATKLSPITFPTPTSLDPPASAKSLNWRTYPFVMSIGYNLYFKNTERSAEVHVLSEMGEDFYGAQMRVSILGFVRPEYDYDSLEGLVSDIAEDCWVTGRSLQRKGWQLDGADYENEREFLWDVEKS